MKKLYSLALVGLSSLAFAQISLTSLNTAYTQNFDGLANTGTGSLTLTGSLDGWSVVETGSNANATYAADNGSSNGGNTYSYGATGSTDRALGSIASGNLLSRWGAQFKNDTGAAITDLLVAYTGEEWRMGQANRGTDDQITFEYSTDATSLTTGTWTAVSALTYNSTDVTGVVGLRDGNSANYRTALSTTITGLNIPANQTFWIRFVDVNITGTDDGLAIDDFSLTPQASGTLATIENKTSKKSFVKNTSVDNEIYFGSKSDVKIFNVNGQLLKTASVSENGALNVAELQKGIYIVTGTVNGKNVSEKVIKK
ncbi:T9SS type A sorting domain-containing protein [Chryseobacterium arthrosphaerae]|uniref:T9SS type A sorting domain-containing protein n=1 Tax=Chryseobacterium arthrosphaerae TaxID=651561 RepID=UPI001BAE9F40|nr:T9SS type A sorting domain-containing protein [Chryseobacterium arthrosphaerae]QUY54487.1 T9SS type A sorting domain-containing protein [Chryseobacterium arthrosphaerae]